MLGNSTLGELKAGGWTLMAECVGRDCGHGAALDLDQLIQRFGARHRVINDQIIARRLRCGVCRHLGGSLRLIPYQIGLSNKPQFGFI